MSTEVFAVCKIFKLRSIPLSGSSDACKGGRSDDHVQVGILVDDKSVVAAELELNKTILKFKTTNWYKLIT
jgi:hypothetical protein